MFVMGQAPLPASFTEDRPDGEKLEKMRQR